LSVLLLLSLVVVSVHEIFIFLRRTLAASTSPTTCGHAMHAQQLTPTSTTAAPSRRQYELVQETGAGAVEDEVPKEQKGTAGELKASHHNGHNAAAKRKADQARGTSRPSMLPSLVSPIPNPFRGLQDPKSFCCPHPYSAYPRLNLQPAPDTRTHPPALYCRQRA
jgi:hypothetical protein